MSKALLPYLAAICLLDLHATLQLTYEEIQLLGPNCSRYDSCSSAEAQSVDTLVTQNCECKPSCSRYDTCCFDSPNNPHLADKPTTNVKTPHDEYCHTLFGTQSTIFAKTKCQPSWHGDPEIKSSCENDVTNFKDPVAALPVTNLKTSVTYKNHFCAVCNDDVVDLVFWNIRVEKSAIWNEPAYDDLEIMRNLKYNVTTTQWGLFMTKRESVDSENLHQSKYKDPEQFNEVFEPVFISFDPPLHTNITIQNCIPNIVSDCHPDWDDEIVRKKCHSYMGIIYGMPKTLESFPFMKVYRNVHCAMCNFARSKPEMWCKLATPYGSTPTLSFSLLLDVNPTGGNRVGEVDRCKLGELYDPFFKKCRAMVCAKKGYKVKNGKCELVE